MTETEIGARESSVAWLHRRHAYSPVGRDHVPRKNLLANRHWPRLGINSRNGHLALHARDVEWKQAAVLDHLARNLVFAARKDLEWNLFAAANAIDKTEICRREDAQVLAVLLVNPLDVLGDHQLDARRKLRVGRLLAARSFSSPLATDGYDESAFFHICTFDRQLIAAL